MEGPFGGSSGQPCLTLHATRRLPPWRSLPNKGRRSGPESRSPRPTPSRCTRCLWSLPAGPNTSPPLPARQASTGKGCAGRQTRRQTSPAPHLPLPCRSQTCHLPGRHPPSLQAHLLSGQSPEPHHQSRTADGAPTLSWALPTAPEKSVLHPPSSVPLLAARGQCVVSPGRYSQPSIDWHQPPLRAKLYRSSELQQEQLFTLHLQAFLKLHRLPENHSILPGMSYVPLPPGSLP